MLTRCSHSLAPGAYTPDPHYFYSIWAGAAEPMTGEPGSLAISAPLEQTQRVERNNPLRIHRDPLNNLSPPPRLVERILTGSIPSP